MANSKNKKPINLDRQVIERFEYLYPTLIQEVLNKYIELCVQDRKYLEMVLFNDRFLKVF